MKKRDTRRVGVRVGVWGLLVFALVTSLLVARDAETDATLSQVELLLVDGQEAGARDLLGDLRGPTRHRGRIHTGLAIADLLDPTTPREGKDDDAAGLDPGAFPVDLIARRAFERGEFEASLRLATLAESLGERSVPLLTAAALVELGRGDEARLPPPPEEPAAGLLAQRVDEHFRKPPEEHGVKLFDRQGRPIGRVTDGELELADGVRQALVPPAVLDVVQTEGPAGTLRLSLDLELAAAALDALRGSRGSIVLLDPYSGEILAAVSDRQTLREGGTPAFEQLREPASIAKIMTTTAALRSGIDADGELADMRCRGHRRFAGEFLYCPYIAGPLRGLDRAMAVSCNVAFASLGVEAGRQAVLDEFRRYGFDSRLGRFPGGFILEPRGDERQLADLSIGLDESVITPLHAALLAAVVAGGGVMPAPTLVAAKDGYLGLHPRRLEPAPGQRVIPEAWIPQLVSAMREVVERGTVRGISPESFPVAMKTGTASDRRYGFHVNYIGFGPLADPRLAFGVRVTDELTSRKVRGVARTVTGRLLYNLGQVAAERGWEVDVEPSETPWWEEPSPRLSLPAPDQPRIFTAR